MRERRTKFNLRREGAEACADYIVAFVSRTKGCHSVYIDEIGDIRTIQDASTKQAHRPDRERLGRYRNGITAEQVEDDLLEWKMATIRESTQQAQEAAR